LFGCWKQSVRERALVFATVSDAAIAILIRMEPLTHLERSAETENTVVCFFRGQTLQGFLNDSGFLGDKIVGSVISVSWIVMNAGQDV
jgi:hypothetical protein